MTPISARQYLAGFYRTARNAHIEFSETQQGCGNDLEVHVFVDNQYCAVHRTSSFVSLRRAVELLHFPYVRQTTL